MRQSRTSIRIAPKTLTAARQIAVRSGHTLSELVTAELVRLLDEIDAGEPAPPVATGAGSAVLSLSHAAAPVVERARTAARQQGIPWTHLAVTAVERAATQVGTP